MSARTGLQAVRLFVNLPTFATTSSAVPSIATKRSGSGSSFLTIFIVSSSRYAEGRPEPATARESTGCLATTQLTASESSASGGVPLSSTTHT